jgi:hypothetical protein
MIYELDSTQKDFKSQLRAFIEDTGWIGIFKKNLNDENKIIGECSLGVTKKGQLIKITFNGKKLRIET